MTLRIERSVEGERETIRLIGRIEQKDLEMLDTQTRSSSQMMCIDLRDVTLIDLHVVHYLIVRQGEGVSFQNIPAFIQEWMKREQI
jgi:hypothetical protein